MNRKILLIEPNYRNKYPPLGLMKISTYHKLLGDEVVFYKGLSKELQEQKWDRVYVTTLFSFHWRETIKTIRYYKRSVYENNCPDCGSECDWVDSNIWGCKTCDWRSR